MNLVNPLERLNTVIDYVESHITEEMDVKYLAYLACCSISNFQSMFMSITEMSVAEYIRKRRLTLAGLELQHGDNRVIDIAIKYGYESPVSFARAFQAFHGITPSNSKNSNATLKILPQLSFKLYVKEVTEMKIVEKEEFYLCGFLVDHGVGNQWGKYEKATEVYEQPELVDWSGYEVLFWSENGARVFTACRQKEKVMSPYYELLIVPVMTWVVFDIDHKFDIGVQYAEVNKWLEKNNSLYTRMIWDANGGVTDSVFEINLYDHQNKFGKERIMELWIPLEKVKA